MRWRNYGEAQEQRKGEEARRLEWQTLRITGRITQQK